MQNRKARKALQLEIRRKVAGMPHVDPYAPCDASVLHARVSGHCSASQYYFLRSKNKVNAYIRNYSIGMQRLLEVFNTPSLQLLEYASLMEITNYENTSDNI